MPLVQSVRVKAESSPLCANTNMGQESAFFARLGARRTVPSLSVFPAASSTPLQSRIRTAASATTLASSSFVTHTNAPPEPTLECTDKLVTSANVRTNIAPFFSKSDAPSAVDSASTICKPGSGSGKPTTSNSFGPPGFGSGIACAFDSPFNMERPRMSSSPFGRSPKSL